jgi:hypothetical protein
MNHAKAIGRRSTLAIGLGIGAALAATSGVASAEPGRLQNSDTGPRAPTGVNAAPHSRHSQLVNAYDVMCW